MKMKEIINSYAISRKALLIYEEKGFIHPQRNHSGYREYNQEDVEMIKKIIILRNMEYSLEEIEAIVIKHNIDILKQKKKDYDKDIHFINTKKLYIDYLAEVIEGNENLDEALEATNDTIKLYKENKYNDMIHFEYRRDTSIILWLVSFIIAIFTQRLSFMLVSIMTGIITLILSTQRVRRFFLTLPSKRIIGMIFMLICLVSFSVTLFAKRTDTNIFICAMSSIYFFYSFYFFTEVRVFLKKYNTFISGVMVILGILIMIVSFTMQLEGLVGVTLLMASIGLIVAGICLNREFQKIIFYIFLDSI